MSSVNYMQTIIPSNSLIVHIDCYDDPNVPDKYIAWIEGDDYRGMCVAAATVDEVLKELSISVRVLEMYRKNQTLKKIT